MVELYIIMGIFFVAFLIALVGGYIHRVRYDRERDKKLRLINYVLMGLDNDKKNLVQGIILLDADLEDAVQKYVDLSSKGLMDNIEYFDIDSSLKKSYVSKNLIEKSIFENSKKSESKQ